MKRQLPENLSSQFHNGDLTKHEEQKHYYGLETGNRVVRRFKLLLRSGKTVSIPYAYLPVITLTAEKQLVINTHDLTITIKGRGLHKIEEWLTEEKVLWIQESHTTTDTDEGDVFVSEIKTETEWQH